MHSGSVGTEAASVGGDEARAGARAFSRVDMPLAAALLVGLSGALALGQPPVQQVLAADPDGDGIIGRILANPYCGVMLGVGAAGLVYALLQMLGLAHDRLAETPRTARLLTGRVTSLFEGLTMLPPEEQAAALQARRRREWQPLQFAIWLLPVLGFIGTVWGITAAIGGLSALMGQGRLEPATAEQVLGGLRFAFDTTLLGLGLAVPLMAFLHWLRARAEIVDLDVLATLSRGGNGSAR